MSRKFSTQFEMRSYRTERWALAVTVWPGTPVDHRLLTISHSEFKRWMYHYHPDQRPSFLFNQKAMMYESAHYSTYMILQADRDALQVQLKNTIQGFKN